MAVVKMNKLSVYGLTSEKESILRSLAYLGMVDFSDQTDKLQDEQLAGMIRRDNADEYIDQLETQLNSVSTAIEATKQYAPKKKLFAQRTIISKGEFEQVQEHKNKTLTKAQNIKNILSKQNDLQTQKSKQTMNISILEPWVNLDIPIALEGTKTTAIVLGILPVDKQVSTLSEDMENEGISCHIVSVLSNKTNNNVCVICHRDDMTRAMAFLKEKGFTKAIFKGLEELPDKEIAKAKATLEVIENSLDKLELELEKYGDDVAQFELLYDALQSQLNTQQIKSKLVTTKEVFLIEGFVPVSVSEMLTETLKQYTVHIELEQATLEDDAPVVLENSTVVEPYEMVTELYSLPQYGKLDPDKFMAPFFWIFFGMMLSDAGYGIVLFVIGLLLVYKFKVTGMMRKIGGLLWQCGISTFIAGFIYGSFFGDLIPKVATTFFGKDISNVPIVGKPIFDSINKPMELLYVCVALGALHIFVGMGLRFYQMWRDGDRWGAIFDIGLWYVVFFGIIIFIIQALVLGKQSVGLYISLAGAIGLVLTQGRSSKNIIMKFFKGLLSLYDITGYLSDLLSYSRILALGLATAVISQVFNTIGTLAGGSIFGAILFIVVFAIGHSFNIAINVLGSFVHTSRLQFVEFFGKFYESGGRPFSPLRLSNKYIIIDTDK